MNSNVIGTNIRQIREMRGMTAKNVANTLGISQTRISNWEVGKNEPKSEHLVALARIYGVSTDFLLGVEQSVLPPEAIELNQAIKNMNQEERRKLLKIAKAAFEKAFETTKE